jgi:trans-aconitate methyltransferase
VNNSTYNVDRFTPAAQQQEERRFQAQEQLQPIEEKLWQQANIATADKILDVGCGTGRTTKVMAMNYHHSQIIGIDRSAETIERARTIRFAR